MIPPVGSIVRWECQIDQEQEWRVTGYSLIDHKPVDMLITGTKNTLMSSAFDTRVFMSGPDSRTCYASNAIILKLPDGYAPTDEPVEDTWVNYVRRR